MNISTPFRFFISILIFMLLSLSPLSAQDTRPILDDIGFCWQEAHMNRLMNYLEKNVPPSQLSTNSEWVAGISPHDDYLYAGSITYRLFRNFKAKEVVIFGVTHRTPRLKLGDPEGKLVFDSYSRWQGPYGPVAISPLREFLKEKLSTERIITSNEGHRLEHSIESMVPFLQYYNRDLKITPIMVTGMDLHSMEELSLALAELLVQYIKDNKLVVGKDIFFLISADANHYGKAFENTVFGLDQRAHELGTSSDKKIASDFLTGHITDQKVSGLTKQLWGKTHKDYGDRVWCGKYSIPFGLLVVQKTLKSLYPGKKLTGSLLGYSDTYSDGVLPIKKTGMGITAPFSLKHWVGFFSAAYYLE